MKFFFSTLVFVGFSIAAHANDVVGVYGGQGRYGQITITQRGDKYLLKTCGAYGNVCVGITAILRSLDQSNFQSEKAILHASWGGAVDCAYPMDLTVSYSNNQIWLSEYSPGYLPNWPINRCPPQNELRYNEYIEVKPYTKK